jgi:hypothetical protein
MGIEMQKVFVPFRYSQGPGYCDNCFAPARLRCLPCEDCTQVTECQCAGNMDKNTVGRELVVSPGSMIPANIL